MVKRKKKIKLIKKLLKQFYYTLIKIEINGINDFSNKENNNESIKLSKENTILLTINECINNQNKISKFNEFNFKLFWAKY